MKKLYYVKLFVTRIILSVGCGDDEDSTPNPNNYTGNDGGSGPDSLSRYATLTRIRQLDGTVEGTYLETREVLDSSETITTESAQEYVGGLRLRSYEGNAYLEEFGRPFITQLAHNKNIEELADNGPN